MSECYVQLEKNAIMSASWRPSDTPAYINPSSFMVHHYVCVVYGPQPTVNRPMTSQMQREAKAVKIRLFSICSNIIDRRLTQASQEHYCIPMDWQEIHMQVTMLDLRPAARIIHSHDPADGITINTDFP